MRARILAHGRSIGTATDWIVRTPKDGNSQVVTQFDEHIICGEAIKLDYGRLQPGSSADVSYGKSPMMKTFINHSFIKSL